MSKPKKELGSNRRPPWWGTEYDSQKIADEQEKYGRQLAPFERLQMERLVAQGADARTIKSDLGVEIDEFGLLVEQYRDSSLEELKERTKQVRELTVELCRFRAAQKAGMAMQRLEDLMFTQKLEKSKTEMESNIHSLNAVKLMLEIAGVINQDKGTNGGSSNVDIQINQQISKQLESDIIWAEEAENAEVKDIEQHSIILNEAEMKKVEEDVYNPYIND